MRIHIHLGVSGAHRRGLLIIILMGTFIMGSSSIASSDESSQITTVIIPINMAFPLLPVQTMIVESNGLTGESMPVVLTDSNGIMAIQRISARD